MEDKKVIVEEDIKERIYRKYLDNLEKRKLNKINKTEEYQRSLDYSKQYRENHKDYFKNYNETYMKEYYQKIKDKIPTTFCEVCKKIVKANNKYHFTSQKHIKNLRKN
jgi:hypothetical protein